MNSKAEEKLAALDKQILGEHDQLIHLDTSDEVRKAALGLATQAQHSVYIWSHDLDPVVYDTHDFVASLRHLVRNNTRADIKILLRDTGHAVRHGHQLVELSRTLSSIMHIRHISPEFSSGDDAFLIADETGLLYRKEASRYTGYVNFNDRRDARVHILRFKELWEKGHPSPELRRLHI